MKRLIRTWLLLPVLALTLSACDLHDSELETHWTFDGYGCRKAGVRYVEVILEDRDGDIYQSGLVRCEAGSVVFEDLPSRRFWVEAYGYPGWRSEPTWYLSRSVLVHEGYNEVTLDLVPAY